MNSESDPLSTHRVTRLLAEWREGDDSAAEALLAAVYEELRRIARGYLHRERSDHTLRPTALVHEAYLQLVDDTQIHWQSRVHFYGIAARVMRRILVDHARAHAAVKRGGNAEVLPLEAVGEVPAPTGVDYLALDDALQRLAGVSPRLSEIVELKFFGGLTGREIADFLRVSERTVLGDWKFARSWLKQEIERGSNQG